MSYNSPNYFHKPNPHFRYSDGFIQPYSSPNNGQEFSPYSSSTPKLTSRGSKMRYHNNSSPYYYKKSSPNNYNHNNSSPRNYIKKKSSPLYYNSSSSSNYTDNKSSPLYCNSSSPYNYNNRDTYHKKYRRSFECPVPISAYYDPSMLENPWEELEKEWQEKKECESNTKNPEFSDTST